MSDRSGQHVGNYRLLRLLGKGAFAEVYLGKHRHLATQAAIKVLRTYLDSQADREHFLREAQTIAQLSHPHIVRVLDFDVEQDMPFLVMEYAAHGSLRARHPRGQQLPLPLVLSYVQQVTSALQYAHGNRLIHRDVKPDNMLLRDEQTVILSDFGIVTIVHSTSSGGGEAVAGTPAYMAPEQLQGTPRPASDQYALAVTVYEWLSGQLPFRGAAMEVATQHVSKPPPSLIEQLPKLPPEVEQVVFTSLAKDPKERFANVQDFAIALERAVQEPSQSSNSRSSQAFSSKSLSQPYFHPARFQGIPPIPNPINKDTVSESLWYAQTPVKFPWRPFISFFLIFLIIGSAILLGVYGRLQFSHTTIPTKTISQVQKTMTAQAKSDASATAQVPTRTPQDIYAQVTSGKPTIDDSLNYQDNNNWDDFSQSDNSCGFTGNAYRITMDTPGEVRGCFANATNFKNFAFQVTMTIVMGDGGGIIFRTNDTTTYRFRVGSDGSYDLIVGGLHSIPVKILYNVSSHISTGPNQSKVLTVIAIDGDIYLYVNDFYLEKAHDTLSLSGRVGLFAVDFKNITEVVYSNAKIWTL